MAEQSSDALPPIFGWVTIAAGCFPIAAAIGLLETNPGDAPPAVLSLCGLVFVVSGLMILLGSKSARLNAALAAVWLLIMGAVATWVSIISSPEGFGGGLPFIPKALNILMGRTVFGIGALFSFGLAKVAIKQAIAADEA